MKKINLLDNKTIDMIAAGEVVERPANVVKELVENAIDSGADAITVEIRDGGISLIRVTDNGSGIEKSQIRNAFLRHATSKITTANDLTDLVSLGFRGEALASIAAVSMVEMISKVKEELTGIRYQIEGGLEKDLEEIGAPDGTTIVVRNLFYNTPPRRKFLKQPQTEGSYIAEMMEHLALSHPQISFHFIMNRQNKFHTSGNDDLREIIYRIYGKDIVKELDEIHVKEDGFSIDGFLGRPLINRSNRNFELFYINGRYIKSNLLSKAIEDGYKEYLMQHKFPFCVLHFAIDTGRIDVNVHPSKTEVRIANGQQFYEQVYRLIYDFLHHREMIPEVTLTDPAEDVSGSHDKTKTGKSGAAPEPFETVRRSKEPEAAVMTHLLREPDHYAAIMPSAASAPAPASSKELSGPASSSASSETRSDHAPEPERKEEASVSAPTLERREESSASAPAPEPEQMELFDDRILSASAREQYEIIGQLFDTYWLVAYQDKLLIIDQHAAHEKVKFERFIRRFKEHAIISQQMNPPCILTLSGREKTCLLQHLEHFTALGFVLEEFGGNDFALCGVPMDLYGFRESELFYELLDELADNAISGTPDSIRTKIATMACKAAVKGNMRISLEEAKALIDELLSLENPYHCPHGRPTIITMSKYELEKKFKRIVS